MNRKEKLKKVLVEIAGKLNQDGTIKWLLGSSGALMLHGLEVEPGDLDFIIDKKDFEKVVNILKLNKINETGHFSLEKDGVESEFIAVDLSRDKLEIKNCGGQKISVNPLEKELGFYKNREGKEKVVKLIEKKLKEIEIISTGI